MEHTLDQQAMKSAVALAKTNMAISEAVQRLHKLEEDETGYLVKREKLAEERIQKVLDSSKAALKEADDNFNAIIALYETAEAFATKLGKVHDEFRFSLSEFERFDTNWDAKLREMEEMAERIRNELRVQKAAIDNEKQVLNGRSTDLDHRESKLLAEQQMVDRAIERLKANRI